MILYILNQNYIEMILSYFHIHGLREVKEICPQGWIYLYDCMEGRNSQSTINPDLILEY